KINGWTVLSIDGRLTVCRCVCGSVRPIHARSCQSPAERPAPMGVGGHFRAKRAKQTSSPTGTDDLLLHGRIVFTALVRTSVTGNNCADQSSEQPFSEGGPADLCHSWRLW